MRENLFTPAASAWSLRPSDPTDEFFSQLISGEASDAPTPNVALFGIPFDGAVIGRKGAREGPAAIREQLARLKPWTLARGRAAPRAADWGDVALPADATTQQAHEATERAARAVLDAGAFPLALGGDHSLTYPLVRAHAGRRRRLGVINLDAHLDVRDVHGGALNSGQSFGRLLETDLVPGENLVEIGIRDFANAPRYADKAATAGATLFGADEWMREGARVLDEAVAIASDGTDGVYLSLDIDVLDQAHAPGVSAPTPGGIDTATLFAALRRLCERAPLVGFDVVETAPPLDRENMTSRAAAYAVAHVLATLATRRGA